METVGKVFHMCVCVARATCAVASLDSWPKSKIHKAERTKKLTAHINRGKEAGEKKETAGNKLKSARQSRIIIRAREEGGGRGRGRGRRSKRQPSGFGFWK